MQASSKIWRKHPLHNNYARAASFYYGHHPPIPFKNEGLCIYIVIIKKKICSCHNCNTLVSKTFAL